MMTRVLYVPDLPLERWPAMDKYAHRLHDWLESSGPGFEVRLAAYIGDLTREARNGRRSGATPKWWAREVDPARIVLPGPLVGPQRYAARYFFYPWRRLRGAARGEHGGAEERSPAGPDRGPPARGGGRVSAAGGRALHGRPGAADRAAGPAALRAQRPVRRRSHAAPRLPRGRRAAVPVAVRGLRGAGARGVRVGTAGRHVGSGRAQGSGRRRGRRRGGARPRGLRGRAGAALGRRDASGGAGGARAGAGAQVHLAEDGGVDGGGVSEAAI